MSKKQKSIAAKFIIILICVAIFMGFSVIAYNVYLSLFENKNLAFFMWILSLGVLKAVFPKTKEIFKKFEL